MILNSQGRGPSQPLGGCGIDSFALHPQSHAPLRAPDALTNLAKGTSIEPENIKPIGAEVICEIPRNVTNQNSVLTFDFRHGFTTAL
jgi:hypothetical protein